MRSKVGSKERILKKLSERIGYITGSNIRKDINVITYSDIGKGRARIIASFVGDVPTFKEMRAWAIDTTNAQVKIFPQTLAYYETAPYPVISFIVECNTFKKPFKEAIANDCYVAVSKNTFLDTDLGTTWTKEEIDGKSFLVRVQQDGLGQALEHLITASGPRMREIAKEIIAVSVDDKDVVKYFRPDTTIGIGTVVSAENGVATIKDKDSLNVYERPFGTILEVLSPGPNTRSKRQILEDYHAQYLGPDLAKQLTT